MTVTFEATPVQQRLMDALASGARLIGFGGGIRGTKTYGSLGAIITLAAMYPGSRWAIVRKDLERIKKNTLPSFTKLAETTGGFVGRINYQDFTARCTNGSEILFLGENIDKDRELLRFHGLEVNGFDLEDADELAERTFVKCIERAGTWIVPTLEEQPPPVVLANFNPTGGWPRRRFYLPWRNGTMESPYAFIPATAADNPFVSPEQWEAWQELPEAEYRRFVEGDWETLTAAYYDTLDPAVHVISRSDLPREIPDHWQRWGSYDWGYRHWSVMLDWVTDPDGTHYLLDALWLRKMQDDELAKAYAGWISPKAKSVIYAGLDCWNQVKARGGSGRSTADVFQEAGLLLERADIDPVNGGHTVNRLLKVHDGRSRVYFVQTPGVLKVVDQLAQIVPADNDIRRPKKVDADEHGEGGDDGADAVRYGLNAWPMTAVLPDESWRRAVPDDKHPGFRNTGKRLVLRARRDKVGTLDDSTDRYRSIRFAGPSRGNEELD